jgi:hypothetical protein
MSRQDDLEARIDQVIATLSTEFSDLGADLRWAIARALVHRAVHHAAVRASSIEFCALATYLADMIGHAHKLSHGDNPQAPAHRDQVH